MMKRVKYIFYISCFIVLYILSKIVIAQPLPHYVILYMPDGQDKDHLIKCYININLSEKNHPILYLRSINHTISFFSFGSFIKPECHICSTRLEPIAIVPHQGWRMPPLGRSIKNTSESDYVPMSGTLLLFDVSTKINCPFYIASRRFTPILEFSIDGHKYYAITRSSIAIGNVTGAIFWGVVLGLSMILVFGWISKKYTGMYPGVICNRYGHLSLARTQILVWTIVVASVVFGFGLIEVKIPDIPTSVLALMGLSLATGSIKAILAKEWHQLPLGAEVMDEDEIEDNEKSDEIDEDGYRLVDLITDESGHLAIAKVQMIIWTLVTLILFVTKSILQAEIWAVPWPMVGMMGMSQLGYLVPDITIRTLSIDESKRSNSNKIK